MDNLGKKTLPGVWLRIIKVIPELDVIRIDLSSIFKIKVGSGENTLFWLDDWLGGSLDGRFPLLFNLDKRKGCFVADRVALVNFKWAWKKILRCPLELM